MNINIDAFIHSFVSFIHCIIVVSHIITSHASFFTTEECRTIFMISLYSMSITTHPYPFAIHPHPLPPDIALPLSLPEMKEVESPPTALIPINPSRTIVPLHRKEEEGTMSTISICGIIIVRTLPCAVVRLLRLVMMNRLRCRTRPRLLLQCLLRIVMGLVPCMRRPSFLVEVLRHLLIIRGAAAVRVTVTATATVKVTVLE